MGRRISKNIIIFLAIGLAIYGLIIVISACSVDMLDYIGNKIEIDENLAMLNLIPNRNMVSIMGGTYTQTDGTESFDHKISDFKLGQYEVTYELWAMVRLWALAHDYHFANPGREGHDGIVKDPEGELPTSAKYEPVTTINWRDAIVWCNSYSEMSGYTPVYENGSEAVIKDSRDSNAAECDGAVPNWINNGYRLPTEGEWQYAASNKGGTPYNFASGATANYNDATETQKVAWYSANSGSTTYSVGTTDTPSAFALWDMSGNISEWCWDWIGNYPGATETDYTGPSLATFRAIRSGSWMNTAVALQVGYRGEGNPSGENNTVGFRLALGQ